MKVLEESTKFQKKIQEELEQMDWRGILADAQQKYQGPEWEQQE